MAYKEYNFRRLDDDFSIKTQTSTFFETVKPVSPSEWLVSFLRISEQIPLKTNKAKSQLMIMPLLMEVRYQNQNNFTIHTEHGLYIDEKLNGACDYIFSKDEEKLDLGSPFLVVTEATSNELEAGIFTCSAQLVALKKHIQKTQKNEQIIYGCVTTGDTWVFLRLSEILEVDFKRYSYTNLSELLGAFQTIVKQFEAGELTLTVSLSDNEFFEDLRKKEFSYLDKNKQIYLDFTGGNLYPLSLVRQHHDLLINEPFGNPHSTNPTSQRATELVENARKKVLDYFNASDYYCIFTQNASNALRIVGECYPFSEQSALVLLSDNHNSVNGLREFSKGKNGGSYYIPLQEKDYQIDENTLSTTLKTHAHHLTKLFAYPAQSNVSGIQHSLNWIDFAKKLGYDVLLDAAAFVPTSKLDLSVTKPDFVSVSFYKIFGYPTGIGCLLVHRDSISKLKKPFFAGGTISVVSVATPRHYLMNGHERFEDGTLNYLGIPAIQMGLEFIESIGIERINKRIKSLTHYLFSQLKMLKHTTGTSIVEIPGPPTMQHRGGTIIINLYDYNGKKYPFDVIEKMTNAENISIRTGCFCNPGIDEVNSSLTSPELEGYYTTHEQGDYYDMIRVLGKSRGAVRISVGIATIKEDLDKIIALVLALKDKAIAPNPLPVSTSNSLNGKILEESFGGTKYFS